MQRVASGFMFIVVLVCSVVSLEAMSATLYSVISKIYAGQAILVFFGCFVAATGFLICLSRISRFFSPLFQRNILSDKFFWPILVVGSGLFVRGVFAYFFTTDFTSDAKVYFDLGVALSYGNEYSVHGTYAYWPPGYPLFLAPFLSLLGERVASVLVANAVLYLVACFFLWSLLRSHVNAFLSVLLLAVFVFWPDLLFAFTVALKEHLSITLLLAVVWGADQIARSAAYSRTRIACNLIFIGVMLAWLALTQGYMILLLGVLPIYWLLTQQTLQSSRFLGFSIALGMVAVLAMSPWWQRNFDVLDQFVPLTTNGGINLLIGNHEGADGSYDGKILSALDEQGELARSTQAQQLAKAWISENPDKFFGLVIKKHILLLGDNGASIWEVLQRGHGVSGAKYALVKLMNNAMWFLLWASLAVYSISAIRARAFCYPNVFLYLSPILITYLVHSFYLSGAKFNEPFLPLLLLTLAALGKAAQKQSITE